MSIELIWPTQATDQLDQQVHRVIHAVTALGGSVGWWHATSFEESIEWLHPMLALAANGDAGVCIAAVDGVPQGLGTWKREGPTISSHRAYIGKIMAHPEGRGLGLGRLVTSALVEDARAKGFEMATLGVRANNLLAIALYTDLGFVEWGRIPNGIKVGNDRFDAIEMCLELQRPEGVNLRGSEPGGLGSSPAP